MQILSAITLMSNHSGGIMITKVCLMEKNNQSKSSSFLFSTLNDSKKRFGIENNENVYSKDSQPAKDVFQKRMVRRYHCPDMITHHAKILTDILLSVLASGNEKIAVHQYCFAPLRKILDSVTQIHGIRILEFADEISLRKIADSGIKAVFLSSSCVECENMEITSVKEISHHYHVPLIVDNTLATSCIVNPLELGADIVMVFSGMISVESNKNNYLSLIDGNTFDWAYKSQYIRIFPFLKYAVPLISCMKFKCRKSAPVLNRENQAEFFMLCEGLQTLDNRMTVHSENARTVAQILQPYAKKITLQQFPNGNVMFLKAHLQTEWSEKFRLSLKSISVSNTKQFYHTYSCTSVCQQGDILYIKCGTEPESYIRHLFVGEFTV